MYRNTLFGVVEDDLIEKVKKEKEFNTWDFIKDISNGKKYLMNEETKKQYTPFIVNRFFASFPELLYYVDAMNSSHFLDSDMQHDFYFYSLPKRNRFKQWIKKTSNKEEKIIIKLAEVLKYNYRKAETAWKLFNESQRQKFISLYMENE